MRDSHGYKLDQKIGRLKKDVEFTEYLLHERTSEGKPKVKTYTVKAGTPVKVVMQSRFGDVGITTDLNATRGYHARVDAIDYLDFEDK